MATGQVDPTALLRFQLNEAQQRAAALEGQLNNHALLAFNGVLSALTLLGNAARSGDQGAKAVLKSWVKTLADVTEAASSKIIVPPGSATRSSAKDGEETPADLNDRDEAKS